MRDTVTLKELLAIGVRRGKRILALGLLFAVLLGIVQAYRQVQAYGSEENTPEQIAMRYEEAMAQYNTEKETLETQLNVIQRKLENQQMYADSSLWLQLDPYNMYVTTISMAITDVAPEAIQGQTILVETVPEFRISKIQNQYLVYWDCSDLETALVNHPYEGASDQYLRELLLFSGKDGGLLKLQAYGDSEESSKALADAALAFLESSQSSISDVSYEHTLTMLSEATKEIVYGELADEQKNHLTEMQENEKLLEELNQQLMELTEPVRESGYTAYSMATSTIKWMVMGFVIGAIIGFAWALIAYLFSNRVETSRQMERGLNIPFLGAVPKKQDCWNDWADRMLGERIWKNQEQAMDYLAGNANAYHMDHNSVALLSTLQLSEGDPEIAAVMKTFKEQGFAAIFAGNVERNPQAVAAVKKSDCVVLVECCGKSKWEAVIETAELTKRLNVSTVGFVLV